MASMPLQKPGRSKQDYGTPPQLLAAIKTRLGIDDFTIDLAATKENAVCEIYYSLEEGVDSLVHQWWFNKDLPQSLGWTWCNPPFGDIDPWVHKAWDESQMGAHIVMLVPSSFSEWWRDWVEGKAYVVHLNNRVKFVGAKDYYPKDCSLLIYTPFGFKGSELWSWR